jgi:hypothetical protein
MTFKKLAHALHHLFSPHCSECDSLRAQENAAKREHELELRVCQSCETLKTQLEAQNQIIRDLISQNNPRTEPEVERDFKPILPKHKPWSVRRAELERADRVKAEELRTSKRKEITADNLEEELQ